MPLGQLVNLLDQPYVALRTGLIVAGRTRPRQ
jgi:hypothetical protein